MKTIITLESMKFFAHHGVSEQERVIGGYYLADISYTVDTQAPKTDELTDTVSYADVFDIVKSEIISPSKLIEHVAGRIMKTLTSKFPDMDDVSVKISKLNPPLPGEIDRATVTIFKR